MTKQRFTSCPLDQFILECFPLEDSKKTWQTLVMPVRFLFHFKFYFTG